LIISFSEDESNDLKDQLIGLEQTLESEKERLNGQLQQLKTEYQEKNDKLSAELTLTSKYPIFGIAYLITRQNRKKSDFLSL
jgi:hypothetical protein